MLLTLNIFPISSADTQHASRYDLTNPISLGHYAQAGSIDKPKKERSRGARYTVEITDMASFRLSRSAHLQEVRRPSLYSGEPYVHSTLVYVVLVYTAVCAFYFSPSLYSRRILCAFYFSLKYSHTMVATTRTWYSSVKVSACWVVQVRLF